MALGWDRAILRLPSLRYSFNHYCTSTSNWGWTVGAGAEYAFYGGWSARIEYDYVGLTNQTFTVTPPAGGFTAVDQFTFNNRNIQMVTAGINYKFGGWGW